MKTERPICEVLSVFGKCEFPSLNTANCSKFNWSAESILHFRETQIESISSSGGSAVYLTYQDLTDITEGPVQVSIRYILLFWNCQLLCLTYFFILSCKP